MFSAKKVLVALLVALAALAVYWMYGTYQKSAQHKAIAALVAEGTAQLKTALAGEPGAESVARIDAALQALRNIRASRQVAMAGAAEGYLVSARAIILRKAEVARAATRVAASRQALAAHMRTPRGRDDSWIRRASEVKKRMDQEYAELERQLGTLRDLVYTFPEAEKGIAPYVEKSLLLGDAAQQAALQRVEAQAKRAAEESVKAGRLPEGQPR
jgi:aspartate/methionine/tyrosine aminotransferase